MGDIQKRLKTLRSVAASMEMSTQQRALFESFTAVLEEIALQVRQDRQSLNQLSQTVEDIDDFLASMTEEESEEETQEEQSGMLYDFDCAQCGQHIVYDEQTLLEEENHLCPKCGAVLFELEE